MSLMSLCTTIKLYQAIKEKPDTMSDEYQKQLKNYRSIVRSNEKIIRMYNKKEETKNVQTDKQSNGRIY